MRARYKSNYQSSITASSQNLNNTLSCLANLHGALHENVASVLFKGLDSDNWVLHASPRQLPISQDLATANRLKG
jgi:hypothetical protein